MPFVGGSRNVFCVWMQAIDARQKACVHVACGGVHVRLGSEVVRVFIRNVFTGMQFCYSQLTVDLLKHSGMCFVGCSY